MSLADAIAQVEQDNPPSLTIADYPMSFAALSELYAERDKQREEAATPAA